MEEKPATKFAESNSFSVEERASSNSWKKNNNVDKKKKKTQVVFKDALEIMNESEKNRTKKVS